MSTENFVVKSLELHLFFGRIMKEHSLFLKAGFTPADALFAGKAEFYKMEFEKLLSRAVALSDGIISENVLKSGEIVTKYTALAEEQTERFTGIAINKGITRREKHLKSGGMCDCRQKKAQVKSLNRRALVLLDGLIDFKESVLERVSDCEMFTANYPLLLEHIIREAKQYRKYLLMLVEQEDLSLESQKEVECFWNQIMMEHAMFIRGLLDPTEKNLMETADKFAKEYAALLETCRGAHNQTINSASLDETMKLRDFKTAGVEGIEQCKIRSIILPLLADHVLREANHYIRLLES